MLACVKVIYNLYIWTIITLDTTYVSMQVVHPSSMQQLKHNYCTGKLKKDKTCIITLLQTYILTTCMYLLFYFFYFILFYFIMYFYYYYFTITFTIFI